LIRLSREKEFKVHRAYASRCDTDKPYRDGGRFNLKKVTKANGKLFDESGLNFPDHRIRDKEYYTMFGPCFAHVGRRYRVDDVGLRGAVTRLTCAREPDRRDLHEVLRSNQFANYGVSRIFKVYSSWIIRALMVNVMDTNPDDDRYEWVHADHPKRELRKRTHRALWNDGRITHKTWLEDVGYKCKAGEVLPPGKYLRATGDLGSPATAKAAYMMDSVKEAFSHKFIHRQGDMNSSFQFVKKPERGRLIEAFSDIIAKGEDLTMKCFSDDGIIGIDTPEGRYVANTDISACDGSNFDPVFDFLENILVKAGYHVGDVRAVFKQCTADCRITSIVDKLDKISRRRKIVLTPKWKTLFSGSTLTTLINNCANFGIFASVHDMLPPYEKRKISEMGDLISRASAEVGFLVKCQQCKCLEDLQFLKISPTMVAGKMEVFLNLGVLLRNLGSVRGDLPGTGSLEERGRVFTSDVIKSYVHAGNHEITDALRTKIVKRSRAQGGQNQHYDEAVRSRIEGETVVRIPITALCARYKVSMADFFLFAQHIEDVQQGQILKSRVLDAIFAADYAYGSSYGAPMVKQIPVVMHL